MLKKKNNNKNLKTFIQIFNILGGHPCFVFL